MSMMDLLTLARAKFGELKVPLTNRVYFPSVSAYTALAKDTSVQVASPWLMAARSTCATVSFPGCLVST